MTKHSLLSFRSRAAERNLLTVSLSALFEVLRIGWSRHVSNHEQGKSLARAEMHAVSRFLSAARFRNDKRECVYWAGSVANLMHIVGRLRRRNSLFPQHATIFSETIPLVALLESTTRSDSFTIRL